MDYLTQQPALWWLCAGVFFLVIEVLTGTLFFFCISGGAFAVALLSWAVGLSGIAQVLWFSVVSVVLVSAWAKYRPNPRDKIEQRAGAEGLNNRMGSFIGREAALDTAIENGRGRVRLDDSYWTVTGPDAAAGTVVRVTAANGMVLCVELK